MNVRFKQFKCQFDNKFPLLFERCKYCILHSISTEGLTKCDCFLRTESVKIVCRQPACNNRAVKFKISILHYINDFNFGLEWVRYPLNSAFKSALCTNFQWRKRAKIFQIKRDTVPLYKSHMHCAGTELGPSLQHHSGTYNKHHSGK